VNARLGNGSSNCRQMMPTDVTPSTITDKAVKLLSNDSLAAKAVGPRQKADIYGG